MSLSAAVYSRWNDAGLGASICDLFRAHPSNVFAGTPEDDDDATLPRAEFSLSGDNPVENTVGHTIRRSVLEFRVWHSSGTGLETALDLIESIYDNSNRAATNPLSISNGSVVLVQFVGRESGPVDKELFEGSVEFEIEWQKQFSVPA